MITFVGATRTQDIYLRIFLHTHLKSALGLCSRICAAQKMFAGEKGYFVPKNNQRQRIFLRTEKQFHRFRCRQKQSAHTAFQKILAAIFLLQYKKKEKEKCTTEIKMCFSYLYLSVKNNIFQTVFAQKGCENKKKCVRLKAREFFREGIL